MSVLLFLVKCYDDNSMYSRQDCYNHHQPFSDMARSRGSSMELQEYREPRSYVVVVPNNKGHPSNSQAQSKEKILSCPRTLAKTLSTTLEQTCHHHITHHHHGRTSLRVLAMGCTEYSCPYSSSLRISLTAPPQTSLIPLLVHRTRTPCTQ